MEQKRWQWLGVDHTTYAVRDIELWRGVYVDLWGFREIHYTADANPDGSSSMRLYGLECGNERIALVSPINRSSISHVHHFLERHGDHSVQHVAIAVSNLEAFVEDMKCKQFKFLGNIKVRTDLFGPIKQIFAKRFDAHLTPAEGPFYEFVERPKDMESGLAEFFSSTVAGELYEDVENDIAHDNGEPFIDFMTSGLKIVRMYAVPVDPSNIKESI